MNFYVHQLFKMFIDIDRTIESVTTLHSYIELAHHIYISIILMNYKYCCSS